MNRTINVFLESDGAGMWLVLPAGKGDYQKAMNDIGAANPKDIAIRQCKTDMTALPVELLMNADLDHVNYLAARLAGMDEIQFAKLDAIMESPFRLASLEQLIEYTYNTDYFLFTPGINNAAELARYDIYDTGLCQMPDEWKDGIDLEKFGAHVVEQEQGVFTSKGYLTLTGDEWKNVLAENGIPGEYRLT